jgi:hypothetical protein
MLSGCLVSEKVVRTGPKEAPPQDSISYKQSERPDSVRVLMVEILNAGAQLDDWLEAARNRKDPIRLECLLDKHKSMAPILVAAKKNETEANQAGTTPEYASYQLKHLQEIWTQAQIVKSNARACPDSQVFEVREVQSVKGPRRIETNETPPK